jgi:hypothetical protein
METEEKKTADECVERRPDQRLMFCKGQKSSTTTPGVGTMKIVGCDEVMVLTNLFHEQDISLHQLSNAERVEVAIISRGQDRGADEHDAALRVLQVLRIGAGLVHGTLGRVRELAARLGEVVVQRHPRGPDLGADHPGCADEAGERLGRRVGVDTNITHGAEDLLEDLDEGLDHRLLVGDALGAVDDMLDQLRVIVEKLLTDFSLRSSGRRCELLVDGLEMSLDLLVIARKDAGLDDAVEHEIGKDALHHVRTNLGLGDEVRHVRRTLQSVLGHADGQDVVPGHRVVAGNGLGDLDVGGVRVLFGNDALGHFVGKLNCRADIEEVPVLLVPGDVRRGQDTVDVGRHACGRGTTRLQDTCVRVGRGVRLIDGLTSVWDLGCTGRGVLATGQTRRSAQLSSARREASTLGGEGEAVTSLLVQRGNRSGVAHVVVVVQSTLLFGGQTRSRRNHIVAEVFESLLISVLGSSRSKDRRLGIED